MASTRNKNTPGNYELEEKQYYEKRIYNTYIHSGNGMPVTSYHPGDGLLPSRMAPTELSNNPRDIESFLFGINSTNLVNPAAEVKPELKTLQSLSVINKTPLIMPETFAAISNQRPAFS